MMVKHKAGKIKRLKIALAHHSGHLDLVYATHSSASVLETRGFPCFPHLSFPQPVPQPPTTVDAVCYIKTFFKLCVKVSYERSATSKSGWMRGHLRAEHHPAFLPAVTVPLLPLLKHTHMCQGNGKRRCVTHPRPPRSLRRWEACQGLPPPGTPLPAAVKLHWVAETERHSFIRWLISF